MLFRSGKPVILLNMTGSAMDLRYFQDHAAAVVQVWYPGARGGRTIAKLLFGEISPSGKLPVTFYSSTEDLPAFEDYSMKGRTYRYFQGRPLYPFGYGLTYGDAEVENAIMAHDPTHTTVTVTVTNKSDIAIEEVVQVYVKALDSPYAPPNPRLCAFARVRLSGRESRQVDLQLCPDAFYVIDEKGEKQPGGNRFLISAGLGQPDERTKELTGKECVSLQVEFPQNA